MNQLNRAHGVLLGTAAGDALGAPYEFGPPLGADVPVVMDGGGPWRAGEWTDDTAMALAIAEAAADGPLDGAADRIVMRWVEWSGGAKDVGIQTRQVLGAVDALAPASSARAAAVALHARTGRSAGNGSLMRTAPVALAYPDDADALIRVATSLSELTHVDPDAGEACVLWCLAIRHAVLTGEADVRVGLPALPGDRASAWAVRIDAAERSTPADFANNGWVVEAFQAAWCAISRTFSAPEPLRAGIEAAVRGGRDADTVAAIAGGLLGAAHGASAVPPEWRELLHGWPGLRADDLVALADRIVSR